MAVLIVKLRIRNSTRDSVSVIICNRLVLCKPNNHFGKVSVLQGFGDGNERDVNLFHLGGAYSFYMSESAFYWRSKRCFSEVL